MATKQSKRMRAAYETVSVEDKHTLEDAIKLLGNFPKAKFDETVELQAKLGVDPKNSAQMVRGTVTLPAGSGRDVRVVVFTENADEALKAGAQEAGMDELLEKVMGGWVDFDVAIATTTAMKEVRKAARVLGPRGLMPNPKTGTVTDDIPAGIEAVKAGRVEFKMDKTANLAVVVGKRSFTAQQLLENANAAMEAIVNVKPDALKTRYIQRLAISSSMSPSVKINAAAFASEK